MGTKIKSMRLALVCLLPIAVITNSYGRNINDSISPAFHVPSVKGALVIDGLLEDAAWQSAIPIPFSNPENDLFQKGGEARFAVRGNYLCVSSRLPEQDRLVVHSTGINPKMWREDMIVWRIYYMSPVTKRNTAISFAVNAVGSFCLLEAENYYTAGRNDVFNSKDLPVQWSPEVLVAAAIDTGEWRVEAALPLNQLGKIGFVSVERYRALRPNAPEMHWYWPEKYVSKNYDFSESNNEAAPVLRTISAVAGPENSKDNLPLNALATEVSGLPKNAWDPKQSETLGINKMLDNSVALRIARYAEEEKLEWQKIHTVKDWESFRDKRLIALKNWLGPMPERTPLHPTVTSKRNYGEGFAIENIVFESRPNLMITANLYLPEKYSKNIPAIVVVHSHHFPKTQIELQEMGMTWARAGAAVLIMDQLCAGERIQTQPWHREGYYGRYNLGNQLYLAGESLIKWMVWDIMRSIDLLSEREYIDTSRIVLVGAVAGGGDPAAVAAAFDPRIAAVIPFNFGKSGSVENTTKQINSDDPPADPGLADWETSRSIPQSVSKQFFPWLICASIAPRYLVYASESKWKYTVGEEIAWSRYKKIYKLYGAEDHLAEVQGYTSFPGPGECNNVGVFHRKQLDMILQRWIKIDVSGKDLQRPIPESDLDCLTPPVFHQYKPQAASELVSNIARQQLDSSRKKRSKLPEKEYLNVLRSQLAGKLGDITPERRSSVKLLWTKHQRGFTMSAFEIVSEPGITLPVFLLTPENTSARRPCVIAISQGGKDKFLSDRGNEIAQLISSGIAVCLPDVRGTGELKTDTLRGPNQMETAANEFLMGNTLTASRLKDLRTVFRWIAQRSDIDPKKISLWGDSFSESNPPGFQFDQSFVQKPGPAVQHQAEPLGPFLAILTVLYEDQVKAIAAKGMLVSFSSVLDDRFCHIPQDIVVPGILTVADVRDIISAIAHRNLIFESMVDGRNIEISTEVFEKEYGKKTEQIVFNNGENPEKLVQWLIKECRKQ